MVPYLRAGYKLSNMCSCVSGIVLSHHQLYGEEIANFVAAYTYMFMSKSLLLEIVKLKVYDLLYILQNSQTVDETAARLRARAVSTGDGGGDGGDGWRALDSVICVDSTWQQATSIMKVSSDDFQSRLLM